MIKFDTIVIGSGPAGIFTAMELSKLNSNHSILIIDEGAPIEKRICPKEFNGSICVHCSPCKIMSGFSGSGAFSDAKLTLYDKDSDEILVGGNLPNIIGHDVTKKLIDYVDGIYLGFGAEKNVVGLDNVEDIILLKDKFKRNNMDLVSSPIRHMGTEKSQELYKRIQDYLMTKENVTIHFHEKAEELIIENNEVLGVKTNKSTYLSSQVVVSVGRKGSQWLQKECRDKDIKHRPGTVDVGIRYELSDATMAKINKLLYEMKLYARPNPFGDTVRSFCQNPSGFVTGYKVDDDTFICNGHSYKEKKSQNTNLAILVSMNFTEPFNEPLLYGKNIARNVNVLAGNGVLVQRYGDILRGKRTWKEDLKSNSVKGTLLDAIPGDLTSAMPYRIVQNIIEYIRMTDKVIEGFAHPDNLLYAPEIKFYSNHVDVDINLETNVKGLYAIGDGSGLTRGLMMASCSGVYVAQRINKIKL